MGLTQLRGQKLSFVHFIVNSSLATALILTLNTLCSNHFINLLKNFSGSNILSQLGCITTAIVFPNYCLHHDVLCLKTLDMHRIKPKSLIPIFKVSTIWLQFFVYKVLSHDFLHTYTQLLGAYIVIGISPNVNIFNSFNSLVQFTNKKTELRDDSWNWRAGLSDPVLLLLVMCCVPLAQSLTH